MLRALIIISGIIWLYWATGCSSKEADKLRFLERGNQAYEKKDYDKALFFYKEALLKDSAFAEAWNNKGLALMQLQRYDAAIEAFNRALASKPGYGEALLNNIKANLAVRQYFAALELTDRLDRVWPDSGIVAFTRGLVYMD
ncbi:MAG TPA: tetratricopeptide repeat protein, partial [Flammeovirgaceae bacterium]|nr:tetratricopeptide repeat protein [Flammeovirgaceae bacterium]